MIEVWDNRELLTAGSKVGFNELNFEVLSALPNFLQIFISSIILRAGSDTKHIKHALLTFKMFSYSGGNLFQQKLSVLLVMFFFGQNVQLPNFLQILICNIIHLYCGNQEVQHIVYLVPLVAQLLDIAILVQVSQLLSKRIFFR